MRRPIAGKVVLITGASSGIGAVAARAFADKGARVVAVARSEDKLRALAKELGDSLTTFVLDVRDGAAVTETVEKTIHKHGTIDILINNAGYGIFDYVDNMTLEQIEDLMDTNFMGVVRCTKAVLPYMKKAGQGHIINVASIAGKIPTAKAAAYTASKHAVHGFSHALRLELKGSGIEVSTINPGPVETQFFTLADPSGQYLDNVKAFTISAEQVARAMIRLAEKPRMEVDIPRYLGTGANLYRAFPRWLDGIVHRLTSRK